MNIGDVSRISGLPAKTIRYYEDIGLIRPLRGENGYRSFQDKDLQAGVSRPRPCIGLHDRRLSEPVSSL